MDRDVLKSAWIGALLLVSGCIFLVATISLNTHLVLFDFIHGNPHRTFDNVIIMIQATANMIHGYVGGDREREERMIAFFKNMLDERFQHYWSNPPKKEN